MKTYNLDRFLDAQRFTYPIALSEIQRGYKRSHWMWYIFPQLRTLGQSDNAIFYGIEDRAEAVAYIEHPILSERLREITSALLELPTANPVCVMSSTVDAVKLCSCMTLFEAVTEDNAVFTAVLEKFFDGRRDEQTLALISGT